MNLLIGEAVPGLGIHPKRFNRQEGGMFSRVHPPIVLTTY